MGDLTGDSGALAVADYVIAGVRPRLVPPVDAANTDVTAGEIVWDSCDSLKLAVIRYGLSAQYPLDDITGLAVSGSELFTVTYTGQVIRCWPSDERVALRPFAAQAMADGRALHLGVACALNELESSFQIVEHSMMPLTFLPPQGGLFAVSLDFTVGLSS
jgi:hypothetical protein